MTRVSFTEDEIGTDLLATTRPYMDTGVGFLKNGRLMNVFRRLSRGTSEHFKNYPDLEDRVIHIGPPDQPDSNPTFPKTLLIVMPVDPIVDNMLAVYCMDRYVESLKDLVEDGEDGQNPQKNTTGGANASAGQDSDDDEGLDEEEEEEDGEDADYGGSDGSGDDDDEQGEEEGGDEDDEEEEDIDEEEEGDESDCEEEEASVKVAGKKPEEKNSPKKGDANGKGEPAPATGEAVSSSSSGNSLKKKATEEAEGSPTNKKMKSK